MLDMVRNRKENRYSFQIIDAESWRGLNGDDLRLLAE